MDPAEQMELEMLGRQSAMLAATARGDSDVQQFYCGAAALVTGASGFLGKQLVEKLLRSTNIKKVFVLIRTKKWKSAKERFDEVLKEQVFELVRRQKPDFADRIVPVSGDVAELRLGLSDHDWTTLADEVDVIFHLAATTRFNEALRLATLVNVRGTREALRLARECRQLRTFVYVSTAYTLTTHSRRDDELLEQLYPSPAPPAALIQLAEAGDDARLDRITPGLIEDWPNTYTFTKTVAEALVGAADDLPTCIVRPSIVVNSYTEPAPGWIDMSAVYGPIGIVLGGILGVLHVIRIGKADISLIPADYTNNATIAAAWETAARRAAGERDLRIYNITSIKYGMKFGRFNDIVHTLKRVSSPRAIGYCCLLESESWMLCRILSIFLHYIPAYIADALCYLFKVNKPIGLPSFVNLYKKMDKASDGFFYFTSNRWNFQDHNTQSLYKSMSQTDRDIYNFNMQDIDWTEMTKTMGLGVKKYLIKDELKNSEYAYKKQQWFAVGSILFYVFLLIITWKILYMFWSSIAYLTGSF